MHNPHNLCYANATLQMFLWLGMVLERSSAHAWACLSTIPFWRQFLQQWQADYAGQQGPQGASEFLYFVIEYAMPVAYEGQW